MLPDGDKIAARNKARRDRLHKWGGGAYQLICKACGVVIKDSEPFSKKGEHYHPLNGCVHAGEYAHARVKGYRGSRWVSVFRPKKYRRAQKLSRKYRKSL